MRAFRKTRKYLNCAAAALAWWAVPCWVNAVSLIPLNSGMQMTCQFVNNTGGQYSNSQIYVVAIAQNAAGQYCHLDASGNMVPCAAGENGSSYFLPLSAFPGFQFPTVMTSARLYVSLGSPLNIPINPGTPVGIAYPNISNPTDPNINTSFDWIEYNIGNGQLFCNTTQVDMFGISMLMDLYDNSGGGPALNGEVGTTESTSSLMSEYLSAVPAAFAGLEGSVRIVAPLHGSFGAGGANAGYFDAILNSVWAQYASSPLVITLNTGTYTGRVGGGGRLAFTKPGDPNTYYVSKPTTNDVWGGAGNLATGNSTELALEAQICAAFHRHVIDNAANLNNVPAYYLSAPADYYSLFWHQHNVNAKAYGFCYDDVNNQSSSLISNNPRAIVLFIGGGAPITPTPTPIPMVSSTWRVHAGGSQYTDSRGNVWSADENYTGGTAAVVSTNAITGALPGAGDQSLYQSQRYGSPFTYVFNVPAGSYQATLKFAETYWTAVGNRVFNVSINGNTVLTNFDIFKTAGGQNRAVDEVFDNITPPGGAITIQFGPASVDNAMVDAIQIIQEPLTPTPTASATRTKTATPTLTRTPTNTATLTKTVTPTSTFSSTTTLTPPLTATQTPTITATSTPTSTPTPTITSTQTNSPTSTVTNTPTIAATRTPTKNPTSTATDTAIMTSTNTPTITATHTPTKNPTSTATGTAAMTSTNTLTPTSTSTYTSTNTLTPLPPSTQTYTPTVIETDTPMPSSGIVISAPYPNPSSGLPITVKIQVPGESTVTIDIFTLAFRKISSQTVQVSNFETFQWDLRDASGVSVANGPYYVRVHVTGDQTATKILKVLVLR